jgi:quercetin dioxygenase-like cupin family protein
MVLLALSWSGFALAQDPVKVDPAHYKVLLENATVRVLKVDYAPGAKSVPHQHPDAIAVPLSTTRVRFTLPDGKTEERELKSEAALYTPAVTHNPENLGSSPIDLILVEFKSPSPGKAAVPPSRTGLGIQVLAEGPYGMAHRVTAEPAFQEPAGTTHEYDQVVIPLGPSQLSLTMEGKPAKTSWQRGEVQFIGRGVPHAGKNLGGKPVDYVIVAVK